jgi:hypothetical protein
MGVQRGSFMPSSSLAIVPARALSVLDAAVPAYAVGGQEGSCGAGRKERRGSGEPGRR